MLKKTIAYKDLDGKDVVDDFYFNVSKPEMFKMAVGRNGDMASYMKTVIESRNVEEILDIFEKFICLSIGQRSEDGKRFIKSDEIRDAFMQTDAYTTLYMEMLENPGFAAEFVNSIVPSDLVEQAAKLQNSPAETPRKEYTTKELLEMPQHEFDKIAGTVSKDMSKEHLMIAFERKSASLAK